MAVSIVQQVVGSAASATGFTTSAVTTTAGNALFLIVGRSGGTATGSLTGVTDPVGNTWTFVTKGSVSGASNTRVELWFTTQNVGKLTSQAISVTSGTAQTSDYSIIEVSGLNSASMLDVASPTDSGVSSATPATPSITTTVATDFVISIIHHSYNAAADTVSTAGWTLLTPSVNGTIHTTSAAYQVESATGTYGPTWSRGGAVASNNGTITAAFKAVATASKVAVGTTVVGSAFVGTTQVSAMYVGTTKIFP